MRTTEPRLVLTPLPGAPQRVRALMKTWPLGDALRERGEYLSIPQPRQTHLVLMRVDRRTCDPLIPGCPCRHRRGGPRGGGLKEHNEQGGVRWAGLRSRT
ncbi:unnamed protein product [Boreogadus saida]